MADGGKSFRIPDDDGDLPEWLRKQDEAKKERGRSRRRAPRIPDAPSDTDGPPSHHAEPVPPRDAWDPHSMFEPVDYSVDNFYTNTTLGEEGSTQFRATISRVLMHRVEAVVQQRVVPDYETVQDFIRDAVYHRLMYLTELMPHQVQIDTLQALSLMAFVSGMEDARRRREIMSTSIELVRKELEEALAAEDGSRFSSVLDKAEEQVINLVDPWRSEMRALIDNARRKAENRL